MGTEATVKMERCHNPSVFESEDISQMLCKLLKLHAAPDVDMGAIQWKCLELPLLHGIIQRASRKQD